MRFVKTVLLASTCTMPVRFPPKCSDRSPAGAFFSLKPRAIRGPGWILHFSHLVHVKQPLSAAAPGALRAVAVGQLGDPAGQTRSWGELKPRQLFLHPQFQLGVGGCWALISAGVG